MIATLIGPYETLSGFALVTNPLQHIVVPAAFVAAAALVGRAVALRGRRSGALC